MPRLEILKTHLSDILNCRECKGMEGESVVGPPVMSKVMIVGQAPGPREASFGRPFAWTAGKMLFSWFESIGLAEEEVRKAVFITAICRCFPGKAASGGDRVPSKAEIQSCSRWLNREIEILAPELIIPVGRLAISQFIEHKDLNSVIGKSFTTGRHAGVEIIPLPHPSGVSTWFKVEPGKTLLAQALARISSHEAFKSLK